MYAAILAGGSGTRLWPLSTPEQPKQFLKLTSDQTMLQETVERVRPLAPVDQLYLVTFAAYRPLIAEQLPDLPPTNVVAEPTGRGTAASIGLAATLIAARDPHAVMASLPADHAIADAPGFRQALSFAEALARQGQLVTLGIQPSYPETGYGYIQCGVPLDQQEGLTAYVADAFVEKPSRAVAETYLRAGNYVWNAGIFVWRVDRILEEIARYLPVLDSVLGAIGQAAAHSEGRVTPEVEAAVQQVWPCLQETVTVDVGIMEKASEIAVIPIEVGWNDIGSWAQVASLHAHDAHGNAAVGLPPDSHVAVASSDVLIYSTTGRLIATAGVSGLVIVDTGDALLVCARGETQLVKQIAEQMQQRHAEGTS
jgi:mannose-1-phosphate guanylyltransferase